MASGSWWKIYPQTHVCNTLELHQFAWHAAKLKIFEKTSLTFSLNPPSSVVKSWLQACS